MRILTSFGLRPLSKGYSNQYLDSFDPRITNEFATAAFRFGHSLIPTKFNQKIGINSPNQRRSKEIKTTRMKDIFFKPKTFQDNPGIMDDLVRGLATQNGRVNDNRFSEDVINHLFESKSNHFQRSCFRKFAQGTSLVVNNVCSNECSNFIDSRKKHYFGSCPECQQNGKILNKPRNIHQN